MRSVNFPLERLITLFKKQKTATMLELKAVLQTNVTMTVFRKLKQLDYLSSCSHSGKYYSLRRFIKFNDNGYCFVNSILFSAYPTLPETIKVIIEDSRQGLTAKEIEKKLRIKPNESLLQLVKDKGVIRKKMRGNYVYFSIDSTKRTQQELFRKDSPDPFKLDAMQPEVLMNEIKASIILFYSLLNEKQRRIYAGLESLKIGRGGDKVISDLLGLNINTIKKGRKELLEDSVSIDTINRKPGGGRKKLTKKKSISHRKD